MRKLIAMVAVAAGLMLGSVANAAQVDIFLTQTGPTDWSLTMSNAGPSNVKSLQLRVIGLDTFAPNLLLAGLSGPDSNISIDPIGDGWNTVLVQSSGETVAIVPSGMIGALLGTLTGAGPVAAEGSEIALESATVYPTTGGVIDSYSITVTPTPTTPEPITMVLLGVGLAALGLVRRSA